MMEQGIDLNLALAPWPQPQVTRWTALLSAQTRQSPSLETLIFLSRCLQGSLATWGICLRVDISWELFMDDCSENCVTKPEPTQVLATWKAEGLDVQVRLGQASMLADNECGS